MPQLPLVHRGIISRKLKTMVYVLEGLNSLATTYFYYYLYFYTQSRFNFQALQNLGLASFLGFVYAGGSFFGGRLAQRFGYFTSIRLGVLVMAVAFVSCGQAPSLWLAVAFTLTGSLGMCCTWPAMEALVSEGEPPARLQGLVGIYNFVWAVSAAFAFFTGGAMLEHWGMSSMFLFPAAILLVELLLVLRLERAVSSPSAAQPAPPLPLLHAEKESYKSPVAPRTFLKMAWVANPMAYLAINTIISTVPTLARGLKLNPTHAGIVCSIWLFTRAAAFVALRLWTGWHYRFRFLAWAYAAMILSFAGMMLAPQVWLLILSQAAFGLTVGLIYYSSLFYSMDVGETKGEHGGMHEAVIGLGNGTGPAIAALALACFPKHLGSGAIADCLVLTAGLVVLLWIRFKAQPSSR
jgi:MFS family permease